MPTKDYDRLSRLIGEIQATLVELFDQLRELRYLLGQADCSTEHSSDNPHPSGQTTPVSPFTPVSDAVVASTTTAPGQTREVPADQGAHVSSSRGSASRTQPVQGAPQSVTVGSHETAPSPSARVARVLDPIAHEIRTGEAPASLLAEYLQTAKEYLITTEYPNERVARDMDLVLRFLRARGLKAIRPEERTNILKRIQRWKVLLSATG